MENRPLQHAEMIRLWTLVIVRVLMLLTLVAFVVWLLFHLRTLLLLLVISVFFCYLIAPLVRLFELPLYMAGREIKLSRGTAIILVYLIIGVLLYVAFSMFWPILWEQVIALTNNLPGYIASGQNWVTQQLNDPNGWLGRFRISKERQGLFTGLLAAQAESLPRLLRSIVEGAFVSLQYLIWPVLIPLLSFFLLKDAEYFTRVVVELMPGRLQKRVHWLLLDVSGTLAAYIRAQITACLVIAGVVTLALSLIGVPYALVLGVVAGVLEFIPVAGPLVAGLIIFGLTLTTSTKTALFVALFLIILRIVQDYIIYPRIIGQGIKMHPILVVIAVLAGAEIGGLSGVFLAIPVVGMIIVGYNHYLAFRGLKEVRAAAGAVSQGAEQALSPPGPATPV